MRKQNPKISKSLKYLWDTSLKIHIHYDQIYKEFLEIFKNWNTPLFGSVCNLNLHAKDMMYPDLTHL